MLLTTMWTGFGVRADFFTALSTGFQCHLRSRCLAQMFTERAEPALPTICAKAAPHFNKTPARAAPPAQSSARVPRQSSRACLAPPRRSRPAHWGALLTDTAARRTRPDLPTRALGYQWPVTASFTFDRETVAVSSVATSLLTSSDGTVAEIDLYSEQQSPHRDEIATLRIEKRFRCSNKLGHVSMAARFQI